MSAVFDTNVWVSALQFGGRAAEFIQLAKDSEIEVFISPPILDETLRVLREKFNRTDLEQIRGIIEQCTKWVEPAVTLDVVKNDPDDNKILECAVAAVSEVIVTGDQKTPSSDPQFSGDQNCGDNGAFEPGARAVR